MSTDDLITDIIRDAHSGRERTRDERVLAGLFGAVMVRARDEYDGEADLVIATLRAAGWRPATEPDPVPRPDLSRLAEMDGYLDELARETGDSRPREFWSEIRRSINAPLRAWVEAQGKGGAA